MKTTKTKSYFLTYTFSCIILCFGCSKNNLLNPFGDCYSGNWAEGYTTELQEYSEAMSAYSENPTEENCTSFKNAAKSYLDALGNIYDCVPTASRAEIDEAIEEAKAEVDQDACD